MGRFCCATESLRQDKKEPCAFDTSFTKVLVAVCSTTVCYNVCTLPVQYTNYISQLSIQVPADC